MIYCCCFTPCEFPNRSPRGDLGAKKKKKKQKRKKEKPSSGGTKSDSASDSQEIKIEQPSKVRALFYSDLCGCHARESRSVQLNALLDQRCS